LHKETHSLLAKQQNFAKQQITNQLWWMTTAVRFSSLKTLAQQIMQYVSKIHSVLFTRIIKTDIKGGSKLTVYKTKRLHLAFQLKTHGFSSVSQKIPPEGS